MIVRASSASKIAIALNALGVKQFGLSLVALALILTIVFWLRPNVASYNGLRLLLNLSPVLVFAALAQMFVMTAGDIDLGIGPYVGLVNCIVAGVLSDRPVLAIALLAGCAIGSQGTHDSLCLGRDLRAFGRCLPGGRYDHRRCQCRARSYAAFDRRRHHRRRRVRRRHRFSDRHRPRRADHAAVGFLAEL